MPLSAVIPMLKALRLRSWRALRDKPLRSAAVGMVGLLAVGSAIHWIACERIEIGEAGAPEAGASTGKATDEALAARRLAALTRRAAFEARPSERSAYALAEALIAAGEYEQLVELADDPRASFLTDPAREALRLEADFRANRYDEARTRAGALLEGLYRTHAALALARIDYRLDPTRRESVVERLRIAMGGAPQVAAEAWLLRARVALDSNAFDLASSAARRAGEAGAPPSRVKALGAEVLIRQGRLSEGEAAILDRPNSGAVGEIDVDARRLQGLIRLRRGDYGGAAEAFDAIAGPLDEAPRGELLRAVARLGAGDLALASQIVDATLRRAPKDWVALDLKILTAAAREARDDVSYRDEIELALAQLEAVGARRLASFRRLALARRRGEHEQAFALIAAAADAPGPDAQGPDAQDPDALSPRFSASGVSDRPGAAFLVTGLDFLLGPGANGALDALLNADDVAMAIALATLEDGAEPAGVAAPPGLRAGAIDAALPTALAGERARRRGDAKIAYSLLEQAADQAPMIAGLATSLWSAARDAGEERAVIEPLRSIAQARASDIDAHLALAAALQSQGDVAAASIALSEVEAEIVTNPVHADRYADLLALAGRTGDLRRFAAQLQASAAKGGAAAAGRAFARAGDDEAAARAFRAALGDSVEADAGGAADGYLAAMQRLGREAAARALLNHVDETRRKAAQSVDRGRLKTKVTPLGYRTPSPGARPAGDKPTGSTHDGEFTAGSPEKAVEPDEAKENQAATPGETRPKREMSRLDDRG
ncbi:MAG: hypothetical protein AAFX08_03145 [Pseudomonadota bacterium]